MHAVGRGSKNAPTFINLSYKGNPESDRWVSFVGKGVCFDTGGYNIKPSIFYLIQLRELKKCIWISQEQSPYLPLSNKLSNKN